MTQPGTDNGERTVPAAGITAQNFEPFIRKHTVAERMEVKIRTVNRLMREKVLGHYKLGQIVRFKWSEVENDLRKHRHVGFDTTPLETKTAVALVSEQGSPKSEIRNPICREEAQETQKEKYLTQPSPQRGEGAAWRRSEGGAS